MKKIIAVAVLIGILIVLVSGCASGASDSSGGSDSSVASVSSSATSGEQNTNSKTTSGKSSSNVSSAASSASSSAASSEVSSESSSTSSSTASVRPSLSTPVIPAKLYITDTGKFYCVVDESHIIITVDIETNDPVSSQWLLSESMQESFGSLGLEKDDDISFKYYISNGENLIVSIEKIG